MHLSSEKYGWLIPVPGPSGRKIDEILGSLVSALCDMPGELVRPRNQEIPRAQPLSKTDWCSFEMFEEGAEGPSVWHEDGHSRLLCDEEIKVLFSFYGPNGREKAKALRDGLWLEQNRAILRVENNISLLRVSELRSLAELVNNLWLRRCDLEADFILGPEIRKPGQGGNETEGYVDIRDIKTATPCGLCGRSR